MESYAISRLGYGKKVNEDFFGACVSADRKVRFTVVADGMGGHAAGDVAGSLSVFKFLEIARKYVYDGEEGLSDFISDSVVKVSRIIENEAAGNPDRKGMGSTIVIIALIESESRAVICNVGDSRAYVFRGGKLTQLTKDHSIAQLMLDKGYTRDEIRKYLSTNAITKAMGFLSGTAPAGLPDMYAVDVLSGDIFMLCSDGLCSAADDFEISAIFRENRLQSLENLCKSLIRCALGCGSEDDITAALVAV